MGIFARRKFPKKIGNVIRFARAASPSSGQSGASYTLSSKRADRAKISGLLKDIKAPVGRIKRRGESHSVAALRQYTENAKARLKLVRATAERRRKEAKLKLKIRKLHAAERKSRQATEKASGLN